MSEKCNRELGDFYFSVLLKWQTWDFENAMFKVTGAMSRLLKLD